jgi:3-dehydroquinate synthase
MAEILVRHRGARPCRVSLGEGALGDLPQLWSSEWKDAAIIGDRNVTGLFAEQIANLLKPMVNRLLVLDFKPGEKNKTRQTKEKLEDAMLEGGLTRETCVVALGGGISLDLAGLVAATFMRGIPYVSIPTTLLAQVDASIGGKTAVNTPHGKNLVGAFHQPDAVLIDPGMLDTLPAGEWPNGLAEAVKHAVVGDRSLFDWMESNRISLRSPAGASAWFLERCVRIKAGVVADDEREQGRRAILNFGHTIAHAVESASAWKVTHGRAVALGMFLEAGIARRATGFPEADFVRLSGIMNDLGLISPREFGHQDFDRILPHFKSDKKRRDDRIRMSLPVEIGQMAPGEGTYTMPVDPGLIRKVWNENLRQPC